VGRGHFETLTNDRFIKQTLYRGSMAKLRTSSYFPRLEELFQVYRRVHQPTSNFERQLHALVVPLAHPCGNALG
jgi:hypothetical protein